MQSRIEELISMLLTPDYNFVKCSPEAIRNLLSEQGLNVENLVDYIQIRLYLTEVDYILYNAALRILKHKINNNGISYEQQKSFLMLFQYSTELKEEFLERLKVEKNTFILERNIKIYTTFFYDSKPISKIRYTVENTPQTYIDIEMGLPDSDSRDIHPVYDWFSHNKGVFNTVQIIRKMNRIS